MIGESESAVDFFIVGAPKAGTTSIYEHLKKHPMIYMPAIKEPNFFTSRELKEEGTYYRTEIIDSIDEYRRIYRGSRKDQLRGDTSVSYLFYEKAPRRILDYNRNARILIMLRDPVERAWSHYLMDRRLGYCREGFKEIVDRGSMKKELKLFYQQYVELGLYHPQVKRYLDAFPRDQVRIFLYDDIRNDMNSVIDEIYAFLGVERAPVESGKKYNAYMAGRYAGLDRVYSMQDVRRAAKTVLGGNLSEKLKKKLFVTTGKPEMDDRSRSALRKIYERDTVELSSLIGRDLTAWQG